MKDGRNCAERAVTRVKSEEIGYEISKASARGQGGRPHSARVESPGKIWVSVGIFHSFFPHTSFCEPERSKQWPGS